MFYLFLMLVFWVHDNLSVDSLFRSSSVRKQAEVAYRDGDYQTATDLYYLLVATKLVPKPENRYNLALCYAQTGKNELALQQLQHLKQIEDEALLSKVMTQLALLSVKQKDTLAAIGYLKESLMITPDNNLARYNYEILKSSFRGDQGTEAKAETRTAVNKPNPVSTPQVSQQEAEKTERKEQILEQLKSIDMSEEQAQALLDAMKTSELQYIYQFKKRQFHQNAVKSDKVEW